MNWTWIVLIILFVLIVILIVIKLHLKKKLDDIDGLGPVVKTRADKNIIASFGDDEPNQGQNKR